MTAADDYRADLRAIRGARTEAAVRSTARAMAALGTFGSEAQAETNRSLARLLVDEERYCRICYDKFDGCPHPAEYTPPNRSEKP